MSCVTFGATPINDLECRFTPVSDFVCRFTMVCSVNVESAYLEIEPTYVWVVDGLASNDVIANVIWRVE